MQYSTKHIWRTLDGRYVPTGHIDAAVLVAAPGDEEPVDFKGFADDIETKPVTTVGDEPKSAPVAEKRQTRRKPVTAE
jgi:hypothetical protein